MTGMRFESFILLIILGFFCAANSNPITSLFGKSSDDKVEADDKAAINAAAAAKAGETTTTTTTTPGPSSSCGGLKGFLHICDKSDPTDPPKNIKTRSVSDDSDDSNSDEDDSSDESEEKEKNQATKTSPAVSEATEREISKRQVGDPEAPALGEVPPVLADAAREPAGKPEEDEGKKKRKRQVDDSDSSSDSDEGETEERQRRDCTDKFGDKEKDCRRKRELVPVCVVKSCNSNPTPAA